MNVYRNAFLIVFTLALFTAPDAYNQVLNDDPGIPDTLFLDSIHVIMPAPVILSVDFYNDDPLSAIEVTLRDNSPDLVIDSFSFAGGRADHISLRGSTIDDGAITIFAFRSDEPAIAPGRGPLGTLFLSYPDSTPSQIVTVDTVTVVINLIEHGTFFTIADDSVISFVPQFRSGYVSFQRTCCLGTTGNLDQSPESVVDIGDLTELIDYLFISPGKELSCYEEANIDGTDDGVVDIGDLTQLICWLFINPDGCPLAPCP